MPERTPFDESYKLLFSHPEMVRDLLLGFIDEEWVQDLDFSTLDPSPTEFITEFLKKRNADVIWRVRFKSQWLYDLALVSGTHKFLNLYWRQRCRNEKHTH